ncbi:MAG: DNA-protecting protein DprA, partial [Ruminococcus sp.]|nr:DNA-protecting protein DprA [Ruminococcus sp.]
IYINPSIAIIGARDADDYAISATKRISAELSAKGITIISGFARGIDSAAHQAALSSSGQTIAVLGCGIDYDYPRNSRNFKEQIAQNGAVISEYFPSSAPLPENFKVRNRIVSGLSDGILVIQAGESSGTLNTASHGLTQGKDIFVMPPHDIFSKYYKGNIGLLRDGAIPVYSSNDILNNMARY